MPGYLKDLTLTLSYKERGYSLEKVRGVKPSISLLLIFLQLLFPSLTLLTTASYLISPAYAQVATPTPTPTPSSSSPATTTFFYDSDGALVYMEERGNETIMGNPQSGALLKTTYIFGSYEESYTPGNSNPTTKRLSLPLTSNTSILKDNTTTYLISKDYLGSTRTIVKDDGTTVSSLNYYPYGTGLGQLGQLGGDQSLPTDRFYTGQRKLTTSNLYYYNARFYSPSLGVFIQPDTFEGPDRYMYAANNPIAFNDPTGLAFASPDSDCSSSSYVACIFQKPIDSISTDKLLDQFFKIYPNYNLFTDNELDTTARALASGPQMRARIVQGESPEDIFRDAFKALGVYSLANAGPQDFAAAVASVKFTLQMFKGFDPTQGPYRQGFMERVNAWRANRAIEPNLKVHPDTQIPYATPIQGYKDFRARFNSIYGKRVYNTEYRGLYVRTTDGQLRVSPANPGMVKHGMLTGGAPVDLAGEFNYQWTRTPSGQKTFNITSVDLESGGYTPRVYQKKLDEANRVVREALYQGLGE